MGNVYLQFKEEAVQKQTDKALMVDCGEEQIWLPKSQISNFERKDGKVTMVLPSWLAKKSPVLSNHLDPEWVQMGCPD